MDKLWVERKGKSVGAAGEKWLEESEYGKSWNVDYVDGDFDYDCDSDPIPRFIIRKFVTS